MDEAIIHRGQILLGKAQFGLPGASQQREGPDLLLWSVERGGMRWSLRTLLLWDAQPEGTSSPFAGTSPQLPVFPRKNGFLGFFWGAVLWQCRIHTLPFPFWLRSHGFAPALPFPSEGKEGGRRGNHVSPKRRTIHQLTPGFAPAVKHLPPLFPCLLFSPTSWERPEFGKRAGGRRRGDGGRDALPTPPVPPAVLSACGRAG